MAMDEREVRSKGDSLTKAISAREPSANILNLLRDLQKGVKPSEDLLRRTQVGKVVNKVKSLQGVDPAIPQLASEIVSQWRNQIQRSKSTTSSTTPTTTNNTASPTPPASSPAPKANGTKLPTGVPLDKRTHKTDNVNKSSLTSEPGRNNSIGLLYDGLVINSPLPSNTVLAIAKSIEATVIAAPQAQGTHTSDFYKDKIRTLYQNLKNKANPELRTRILNGQVSPERFATMTHEEMKSEKQKAEDAKIQKENLNNAMVAQEEKSISNHLECSKCRQRKVSFTQAQTRSADEPMTTFCECMNCGNRWKFS